MLHQLPIPVLALIVGVLSAVLTGLGTRRAFRDLNLPPGAWPILFSLLGGVLGAAFIWTSLQWGGTSTPDVVPPAGWREWRAVWHVTLIILLLIITATDLKSYYILTWCCLVGLGIAIVGAFLSGQFQIAHVWVDWNAEIPQLQGPYLPKWLSSHRHLHGFAWSLAGMTCGIVLTGVIRSISAWILGVNALGSGDVWLMAMVGAYLGWQPVIVATLLAPVLALGIGGAERLLGNRAAIPYGPFLALASLIVLFCWRWIWMAEFSLTSQTVNNRASVFAVRRFFGDPLQLVLIGGGSLLLLVLLLGLLKLYKSLSHR